ncbi:hypothetical protein AB0I49_02930 [Streptomyces sp. NPDC050617]|uniref:hypothetical protein n=1 Tax=Streptomyces sp. NPDC050617 TaxID=3154628 RepID=UPI00341B7DAB
MTDARPAGARSGALLAPAAHVRAHADGESRRGAGRGLVVRHTLASPIAGEDRVSGRPCARS